MLRWFFCGANVRSFIWRSLWTSSIVHVCIPASICSSHAKVTVRVTVLIGSANRDERRFSNPDVLDFDRTPNRHLAFGGGDHTCLGLVLARAQLRALLNNFFSPDAPGLAKGGGVEREINPALRGFSSLPLVWT